MKALRSPSSDSGTVVTVSGAVRRELDLGAQELARALGRKLYRVDLKQVASKYIGETEKQIETILRQAQASDAVLLFEDGDALFGDGTSGTSSKDGRSTHSLSFVLERLAAFRGIIVALVNQPAPPSPKLRLKRRLHIRFPAAKT